MDEYICGERSLSKSDHDKCFEEKVILKTGLHSWQEFSSELPFIIKYYESETGFSKFIHNPDNTDLIYKIMGPYGTGLELTRESDGLHVIVAGGTGILPFMDLLNFLLMREMYNILLQRKGEDIAAPINP